MPDFSGKSFGQYRLIEPIASGGMATIYTAHQPGLERTVAVKVLPEFLLNQPGFIDRFKIEAQAVAKLDHPHILPIYDYGHVDQVPYLVMKYVPSGTLKDMMAGPVDPKLAAAILRQIAEALDHAHRQGVVHRDVKPSNVLMQDGKWALLTDFGLAKILTHTSQITASGASVGTPDYMSPEQARGDAVDARSDIYSLGVIAYQMLSGDVPFHAETPTGVMLKHVLEAPPSPREFNPDISAATEDVILRVLSKSPDERFSTALDLVDALERSLDENATRVTEATAPSWLVAKLLRARLPLAIGLGAVVVIALAVLLLNSTAPQTPTPPAALLGNVIYDDFSASRIDATRWMYSGTYTATLNSEAVSIQNSRLAFQAQNPTSEFYNGGVRFESERALSLVSARVTLLDATGYSDIGIQVNGLNDDPNAWVYLSMSPSDATTYAYLGDSEGTKETFSLAPGTGMPSTHELAIGWDGEQLTFYIDSQPRKKLATTERGHYVWLQFNVDPGGHVTGSFDDVRVTYADQ